MLSAAQDSSPVKDRRSTSVPHQALQRLQRNKVPFCCLMNWTSTQHHDTSEMNEWHTDDYVTTRRVKWTNDTNDYVTTRRVKWTNDTNDYVTTRRVKWTNDTNDYVTLCLPEDDAALPRDETSLHGLREDSRFVAFSPSLQYLSPFTGDIACTSHA